MLENKKAWLSYKEVEEWNEWYKFLEKQHFKYGYIDSLEISAIERKRISDLIQKEREEYIKNKNNDKNNDTS